MKGDPVLLTEHQRSIADEAIREHCGFRNWQIVEVNCRTNHVHLIVTAFDASPERVMDELKAYATRALRRAGFFMDQKPWTRHGSTRYIKTQESLNAAIRYVQSQ
jgi:REP element-mobilizing transposase RayT